MSFSVRLSVFVYVCVLLLHVALSWEIEGLHIAWNSQAWFWKKRPQHLFLCVPLFIHVLPIHWLALAFGFI